MKNKFCREILSLTLLALLFLQLPAQRKALKIGDTIPEEIWTTSLSMVNSPNKTTTLDKDRDKLILLDFWATWCGSCLKNFPKMQELEKQFDGGVKVIPITGESTAVLDRFFSTKNGRRYNTTASVKEDKIFHQLFPHTAVPYIVWIKNGTIINTTDAEQVTEQTVAEILNDENSSLQTVIYVDRSRPFMLSENFDLEKQTELQSYTFLSKGRIRAAAAGSVFRRKNDTVYGRLFSNVVLMFIYRGIAEEIFFQNGEQFSDKRIISSIESPSEITFDSATETVVPDARFYTFEYIDTIANADYLYDNMLLALNRSTDYIATIQKQKVKCLVIRQNSKKEKQQQQSKTGLSMQTLVSLLNADSTVTSLTVIDESGLSGNSGIEKADLRDLPSLKNTLAKNNLKIVEEERSLMMFVIKDK